MLNTHFKTRMAGMGLIEIIFAVSVVSTVLLALMGAYNSYLNNSVRLTQKIQASFLAEEGVEAVRSMRDVSWNGSFGLLNTGTTYYLSFNGTNWNATTTPTYIDNLFLRSFSISSVNRDGNDDITTGAGTLDQNTKKVTVNVAWNSRGATSTQSISTYFTNLFSD